MKPLFAGERGGTFVFEVFLHVYACVCAHGPTCTLACVCSGTYAHACMWRPEKTLKCQLYGLHPPPLKQGRS